MSTAVPKSKLAPREGDVERNGGIEASLQSEGITRCRYDELRGESMALEGDNRKKQHKSLGIADGMKHWGKKPETPCQMQNQYVCARIRGGCGCGVPSPRA